MISAWDTLRVRVTVLLVGAILLVVILATSLSFFFMGPGRFQAMDDSIAAHISIPLGIAEAAGPGSDLGPAIRAAPPPGRIMDPMTRGVGEALGRLGFRQPVTVVEGGPGMPFQVAVRLSDGRFLVMPAFLPPPPSNRFGEMLSWFLLIAIGTTVATAFAIQRLTRPLAIIEDALGKVGPEGELPWIEERGTTELRAAARTINRLSERLKAAMESRMRIVAAAAHDLRTPMTRLRFRLEDVTDPALRRAMAGDIAEMEQMVDATLSYLRGEASDEPVRPLDLVALVETIVDDARDRGLCANLSAPPRLVVAGRLVSLKRMVSNLIENALAYGGSAHVTLADEGTAAVLAVRDHGPGIPEDQLAAVIEPFVRIEASRSRATGGVGLGLTIARTVAEAHGGTLTLANAPDGGLVATVRLPKVQAETN